MGRSRDTWILIAVAAFIVVAAVIRFFGGPIVQALVRLHGPGPSGH